MKIYKKARLLCTWVFTKTKTTAAIDITNTCNLKCTHCYWWKEERPTELGDEAMVAFMKGLRSRGMTAAIIYGGEPMLRPRICNCYNSDGTQSSAPMETTLIAGSAAARVFPFIAPPSSTSILWPSS